MIAKDLNPPPPPQSNGSQLHESFAHPWVAVKIISRTPYYHAPKYYHAHDNEGGGGFKCTKSKRKVCLGPKTTVGHVIKFRTVGFESVPI